MGINSKGKPYAERNPLEGVTPAPDREDEHYETELITTIDEKEAKDTALRLEQLSRDTREKLETELLPHEQHRADELVLARNEARRRERAHDGRKSLADKRIATWEFVSLPQSNSVKTYERYSIWAVGFVEGPLAFVAGYALVGGIQTGDAQIDTPLKLAPIAFAFGIALICCFATICAGRVLGAYYEQQGIKKRAELARQQDQDTNTSTDDTSTDDTSTDDTEEQAA